MEPKILISISLLQVPPSGEAKEASLVCSVFLISVYILIDNNNHIRPMIPNPSTSIYGQSIPSNALQYPNNRRNRAKAAQFGRHDPCTIIWHFVKIGQQITMITELVRVSLCLLACTKRKGERKDPIWNTCKRHILPCFMLHAALTCTVVRPLEMWRSVLRVAYVYFTGSADDLQSILFQ